MHRALALDGPSVTAAASGDGLPQFPCDESGSKLACFLGVLQPMEPRTVDCGPRRSVT